MSLTTTVMVGYGVDCRAWRHFLDRASLMYRRCFPKGYGKQEPRPKSFVRLPPIALDRQIISLPSTVLKTAESMQSTHDAHMRYRTQTVCRTQPMEIADVAALLPPAIEKYTPTHELTAGGMSRIYATKDPNVLLKISDISRGWSKHETTGYDLLASRRLPSATVLYAGFHKGYLIIAVEKMGCTVSSVIRSLARTDSLYLDEVVCGMRSLLTNLRRAHITFCDLSPDNIVCRHIDTDEEDQEEETVLVELVLIDPQFAVPTTELAIYMGERRAEEFDTVHLSLKIMAMGAVSQDGTLRLLTDAACCALLGLENLPSEKSMTQWLLQELPMGLRLAYRALDTFSAANKLSSPTISRDASESEEDNEEDKDETAGERGSMGVGT